MHQPYANDNRLSALPHVTIEASKIILSSIKWSFNPREHLLAEQVFDHLFSEYSAPFSQAMRELPIIKRLPVYSPLAEKPTEPPVLRELRAEIKRFCLAVIASYTKEADLGYSLHLDERAKDLVAVLKKNYGVDANPQEEIDQLRALLKEGCFRVGVPEATNVSQRFSR